MKNHRRPFPRPLSPQDTFSPQRRKERKVETNTKTLLLFLKTQMRGSSTTTARRKPRNRKDTRLDVLIHAGARGSLSSAEIPRGQKNGRFFTTKTPRHKEYAGFFGCTPNGVRVKGLAYSAEVDSATKAGWPLRVQGRALLCLHELVNGHSPILPMRIGLALRS